MDIRLIDATDEEEGAIRDLLEPAAGRSIDREDIRLALGYVLRQVHPVRDSGRPEDPTADKGSGKK